MKKIILFVFFFLFVCSSQAFSKEYQRIISLIPSATEIVFAINVQDKLVGVTRFCRFPEEAKKIASVGDLFSVNYEVIYGLQPDAVIVETNYSEQKEKVKQMGIDVLSLETKTIQGVIRAIKLLGEHLNRRGQAEKVVVRIQKVIDHIQSKTAQRSKPRVLISFLRPVGEGTIREMYIAGQDTFFEEILEIAGGRNAYEGTEFITSPIISPEGILRMNPDIIIEIMTNLQANGLTKAQALKDWDMLRELDAYKNNKIFILTESYLNIPGPRIDQTLMDFVKIIHPEVDFY